MRRSGLSRPILVAIVIVVLSSPIFTGAVRADVPTNQESALVLSATTGGTSSFPVGVHVTGMLDVDAEDSGGEVDLLTRPVGMGTFTLHSSSQRVHVGVNRIEVALDLDFRADFVPAGLQLEAIWRLARTDATVRFSEAFTFWWMDDRFDWTTLTSPDVAVHTFDSDPVTIRAVLGSTQATIDDLRRRFKFPDGPVINVWMYRHYNEFSAITIDNSRESIAGLSYPAYSVTGAVIHDDRPAEISRVLPHEVSHQMLYRATSSPLWFVPLRFDEGLATNVQTGGTDGYPEIVRNPLTQGQLFELSSLSISFPVRCTGRNRCLWCQLFRCRLRAGPMGRCRNSGADQSVWRRLWHGPGDSARAGPHD